MTMPDSATTVSIRESQRAPTACSRCAQRRVKCDKKVPCGTCLARGLESSCAREVVKIRGRITSSRPTDHIPTYYELHEENTRLKAELAKFKSTPEHRPSANISGDADRQVESTIKILESKIHLQEDNRYHHDRKVRHRSDIYMPTQECSNILLNHGFSNEIFHAPPLWLAIYFGFIAMSLLFMDEREATYASLPSGDHAKLIQNWYEASLFFLYEADFLRSHDMRAVQTIAILLGLAKNVGDFSLQPMLQAAGLRIGRCLGMDREPPAVSDDPVVQEVSRRTWWTVIICEWLQRPEAPPCIQESDFDVHLPMNLTDEELTHRDLRDDHDAPHYPRPVQYHLAMISLAQLKYRFEVNLERLGPNAPTESLEALVNHTDEALANLIEELPGYLSLREPTITLPSDQESQPWIMWQGISLSLTFLFYRMTINRALQHRWVLSEEPFPRSQAICLTSAHAIISLVNQHRVSLARHRPWATASNLFSAAVTLAIQAQFSDGDTMAAYIESLQPCMAFFRSIQNQNAVAAQALAVLTNYIRDISF